MWLAWEVPARWHSRSHLTVKGSEGSTTVWCSGAELAAAMLSLCTSLSSPAACLLHPCRGAEPRAALSHSLSICGYMHCPFPNHTLVLRSLFPFFGFLLSFFPLWCAPLSPCSLGLSSSFPVHPRGPFPTLPVVAVSNSIVLLGTEANGVINYLLSAGPSSEGDR